MKKRIFNILLPLLLLCSSASGMSTFDIQNYLMLLNGDSFDVCTVSGYENRFPYSTNLAGTGWTVYGTPSYNGEYHTITQSSATISYLRRIVSTDTTCTTDGQKYIFRGLLQTEGSDLGSATVNNAVEGNQVIYMEPNGLQATVPWYPFQIEYTMKTSAPSTLVFVGGPNPAEISNINIKNIQHVPSPGAVGVFYGDSHCEVTMNNDAYTSGINFPMFYAYYRSLFYINRCESGETLSQIYARMVSDLAAETYDEIALGGGTNDLQTSDLVTMQTTMTNMITLALSKLNSGGRLIVFGLPPNWDQTNALLLSQFNSWEESYVNGLSEDHYYLNLMNILGSGGGTYGTLRNPIYYDDDATENHYTAYGAYTVADFMINNIPAISLYTSRYLPCYIDTGSSCIIQ